MVYMEFTWAGRKSGALATAKTSAPETEIYTVTIINWLVLVDASFRKTMVGTDGEEVRILLDAHHVFCFVLDTSNWIDSSAFEKMLFLQQTTVALAGLAAISPAATALCSYHDAVDVADRLLVCLESGVSIRVATNVT